MQIKHILIILMINSIFFNSFIGYAQSFQEKLDNNNLNMLWPTELNKNNVQENVHDLIDFNAIVVPPDCECEVRYIINESYKQNLFLPPHAELVRLLGTLGSNSTNTIMIEQNSDNIDLWTAIAHFAPKSQLTSYAYGSMRSTFIENQPLIHVIIFYNNKNEKIDNYLYSLQHTIKLSGIKQ